MVALVRVVNFQEKPPEAYISRVKTVERKVGDKSDSRESYRRVKYWPLPELQRVDGKSVDTDVLEFDLHFDKGVFKWIANNVMEKKNFIACLYKVSRRTLFVVSYFDGAFSICGVPSNTHIRRCFVFVAILFIIFLTTPTYNQ